MAVHKLETWFTNDLDPEWPCPSCHRLSLKIMRESFFQHDTRSTQENLREYWFEPDQHTSVFSCLAKCTRDNCREVVTCSGEGIVEANIDTETGQKLSDYEQLFCPRFFSRPCTRWKYQENVQIKSARRCMPLFLSIFHSPAPRRIW